MANDPVRVQALRLVDEALQTFDSPNIATSVLVRKAQRIAVLRHDYAAQIGLLLQTTDVAASVRGKRKASELPALAKAREHLATLVGAHEAAKELERQYERLFRTRENDDGNIIAFSVTQLEENVAAMERAYDAAEPPPNLTPIDAAFAAERAHDARMGLLPELQTGVALSARFGKMCTTTWSPSKWISLPEKPVAMSSSGRSRTSIRH